ncbi:tm2 domain-containing protein [Anaeramoeba ignava]|uniref:Tm2 domain-containing protein n=1 Tax=Anaeramoeba ignava TaxID=1746090 RepID=A0A9Q0LN08_ANAIG|nr:tm2 domain-containing protein [Anaeramoeba ignava]
MVNCKTERESFINSGKEYIIYNDSIITQDYNKTDFDPNTPLIQCEHVPPAFYECFSNELEKYFSTYFNSSDLNGCDDDDYGGRWFSKTKTANAVCVVVDDIECFGPRQFIIKNIDCRKYNNRYFSTAMILSVFLGYTGADRFYMGNIGCGIGKLLTLGGVGIWWLIDTILILTGVVNLYNGYSYEPYN